ncbi:MAG TPA: hypothetical protein VG456_09835 [Candidatus Sulfopaludibacter sp.]|jgi:hypothetical protein|nr:hypothetical protein [Candidatus Sulfopaludibacter sp.]
MNLSKYWITGAVLAVCCSVLPAHADAILDPSVPYGLRTLSVANLPTTSYPAPDSYYYESLAFYNGNLLVAVDNPLTATEAIWQMNVQRNSSGQITGLNSPSLFATVYTSPTPVGNPFNGGIVVDSNGTVIYSVGKITPPSASPFDLVGQVSGASNPLTNITPLSQGGTITAQGGISGMGNLVYNPGLNNYSITFTTDGPAGTWWKMFLAPPVGGIYTITGFQDSGINVPSNSFVYVQPGQTITESGVLVEFNNEIMFYDIDANGLPTGTGQSWVYGNDQILKGLVRDPVTGDVLMIAYPFGAQPGVNSNQILLLGSGSLNGVPEPSDAALGLTGIVFLIAMARRKGLLNRQR